MQYNVCYTALIKYFGRFAGEYWKYVVTEDVRMVYGNYCVHHEMIKLRYTPEYCDLN